MDPIDPVWLFGAIALACGIFIGMLINRMLNPSAGDVDQLKADLQKERTEMERYKESVNSHFDKTSDLVNELTQDYVKVYRHLAEGAQTLSDTREFTQVLEQPQGKVLISVDDAVEPTGAESPQPGASRDDIEDVAPAPVDSEVAAVATGTSADDADRVDTAATDDDSERLAADRTAVNAPNVDEDAASAAADKGDQEPTDREADESDIEKDSSKSASGDEADDSGKDDSEDADKTRTEGAGEAAEVPAEQAATDTPRKT